ncbi:MAG: glycosyltransferase family 4 protein [Acidobacteria bacterium]|nr:glycosyltransferase family 4 protein [Acidobacteriota bacterium]
MRVLYFSDNCSVHNRRFLEKLAGSHHEIWFLDCTRQAPPDWLPGRVRWVTPACTVAAHARPEVWAEFVPAFASAVRTIQPDLVHAGPVTSAGYITALAGFHPLLVTSWGSDVLLYADRDSEYRSATEIVLRTADGFFCDCDAVRERAAGLVGKPSYKMAQFPWGVDREEFSPTGPKAQLSGWQANSNARVFLCTRSWEELYGIGTLLQAFQLAYSKNPDLRLVLLGNGSLAGEVDDFIRENGLTQVVLTAGNISPQELPQWFRAADAYISCAQCDGTSVSLLEAMATGLPVLVTDIPSNREWVTEGENGWLAPFGDVGEFAARILEIAALSADQRAAMSQNNQEVVAKFADWNKNFPQLLELYEVLVPTSVHE